MCGFWDLGLRPILAVVCDFEESCGGCGRERK